MTDSRAPSVDALVGLDLWSASNAADTLTVQLGRKRKLPSKRDPDREVGDYALHVQCRHDVTEHGTSVLLSQLLQRRGALKVKSIAVTAPGTFVLELDGDVRLCVFADPDADHDDEQWRLFVPGGSSAHLVFAGGSLREE